jgi:hypothetical protein
MLKKLIPGGLTAMAGTLLLVITIPFQMWNFHLFTESLFLSVLILLASRLFIYGIPSLKNALTISVLFLALSFLRPTGVLLLAPISVYIWIMRKEWQIKFLIPIIVSVLLVLSANLIFATSYLQEYIVLARENNWVVWKNEAFPAIGSYPELLATRAFYYFAMTRPYFSDMHNLLMMSFYPVYLLALIGIPLFWKQNKAEFLFTAVWIFTLSIFSIATFLNWHARFITPLLPFFILMAAFGIKNLTIRLKGTPESTT